MFSPPISRRRCLALGAGLGLGLGAFAGQAASADTDLVVVELFTSQACPACSDADALLAELCMMPGVLAVTYHIDYWDYLGWRDTLARPEFSQRQYDYAKVLGNMDVFTPQIVINGTRQVPGGQRDIVLAAISEARQTRWPAPLNIAASGADLVFDIGAGVPAGKATLWVMAIADHVSVKVEKGQLAGRDIAYCNVVRKLVPAGVWDGSDAHFVLNRESLLMPEAPACVALLQQGTAGPVLGCAAWGAVIS